MATDPTADILRQAAVAAGRAPSIHNSQPWRWRVDGANLDLFLRGTDPATRFAVLSCGAALHHARVHLAAQGADTLVHRMPDPAAPDHLARIRITGRIPVEPVAVLLAQAAEIRQTDRRDAPRRPLDTDKLRCVAMAVRAEGAELRTVRSDQVYALARAEDLARKVMTEEPGWESGRTDWAGDRRPLRAGVPAVGRERVAGAGRSLPGTTLIAETHERVAVFAVLHGPGDERPDWLRAGEALSAGWLTATRLDVAVLPLSAVIAVPDARGAVRRLVGGSGWPYLVLRFASAPDESAAGRTPRLPAPAVVEGL
jgi:hypothetical protein